MALRFPLATFFLLLLLLAILLCNLVQAVSFVFLPFAPGFTRRINRECARLWFNSLVFCLFALGVKIRETGDDLPAGENVFFVANHQAMADIPVVLSVARKRGRTGDTKWFVKDPLKWVPGIGWGLILLDCLFVKRNWAADRESVMGVFARLRESGSPFWVMSFLEGTRSTPQKIAKSQAYARRQNLTPLRHLLMPRTKGFEATLEGLGGKVQAVYDCTIAYDGPPPNLLGLFYRTRKIDVFVRRFPIAAVGPSPQAWVNQLFVEKDRLLDNFISSGAFRL